MALANLFKGVTEFIRAEGENVPVESLQGEGKVLGIYFSAHWCPPCRGFTPKLASWYNKVTTDDKLKGKFEIVFVSSDKNEEKFDEYRKEMPWTALSYSARSLKESLSRKFKVQGIPTLMILDAGTGEVITGNGRDIPSSDPEGAKFPWVPPTLEDVMNSDGGKLINKDGNETTWADIKNTTIGLYFSAHWCGPCRSFTPQFAKFYKQMKEKDKNFEVVFISSDRDEQSFKEYLNEMPWWALPFENSRKDQLSSMFEVSGIPTLIILDGSTGTTISTAGRAMVTSDPNGEDFPWKPKPLEWLHPGAIDNVQERPCMIWFTDGSDEQISKAKEAMTPVATPYFEEHKNSDDSVCFLYTKNDDLSKRLFEFTGIKATLPCLVITNLNEKQRWEWEGSDLDQKAVAEFLEKWQKNEIKAIDF